MKPKEPFTGKLEFFKKKNTIFRDRCLHKEAVSRKYLATTSTSFVSKPNEDHPVSLHYISRKPSCFVRIQNSLATKQRVSLTPTAPSQQGVRVCGEKNGLMRFPKFSRNLDIARSRSNDWKPSKIAIPGPHPSRKQSRSSQNKIRQSTGIPESLEIMQSTPKNPTLASRSKEIPPYGRD